MKKQQQAAGIIDADPELVAWSDDEVQASIKEQQRDDPSVKDGPVLCHYKVGFMYPFSYDVEAFTVAEAVAKAIALLREDVAVHDPQVEWVSLKEAVIPVCECCGQQRAEDRVVAKITNAKVAGRRLAKL